MSDTPKTDEAMREVQALFATVDWNDHDAAMNAKHRAISMVESAARQLERDFNDAMHGAAKLYNKLKATRPEALMPHRNCAAPPCPNTDGCIVTGCRAANTIYVKPDNVKSALLLAQSALRRWTDLYARLQNESGELVSRKLDYNLPPGDHVKALEAVAEALEAWRSPQLIPTKEKS